MIGKPSTRLNSSYVVPVPFSRMHLPAESDTFHTPVIPSSSRLEQSGVAPAASSNTDCDAFLVVRCFLGSVLGCLEICRHHMQAFWTEPTDIVGVTYWAALESYVSFGSMEVTVTRPPAEQQCVPVLSL
jgi:hypothetical protein